jgi:uncharacterized protein YbbC (DUF1343 family)
VLSIKTCILDAALFGVLSLGCSLLHADVKTGADILIERRLDLAKGKNIGLITNQTGRLSSGELLLDALRARGVHIVALFSPEHGIRSEAEAGASIQSDTDIATGIPIYSLFGKTQKPDSTMLKGIDLLIYDMQDVGVRFYTYISTMGLTMEAAAEAGIPFLVLDRPDPLGGVMVDGPILDDSLRSFVGMYPLPVVYGLTCGELAQMINGEKWLAKGVQAALTVVPMEGWTRGMAWSQTGLTWNRPSPNIPAPATALVYPVTCYIEGTNLSEGRGTDRPFNQFGAPFLDAPGMAAALDSLELPGVRFGTTSFTPQSSKYAGQFCYGVTVEISDPGAYRPVSVGLHIINLLAHKYPKECEFNGKWLARLFGSAEVLEVVNGKRSPEEEVERWRKGERAFVTEARIYQIYR